MGYWGCSERLDGGFVHLSPTPIEGGSKQSAGISCLFFLLKMSKMSNSYLSDPIVLLKIVLYHKSTLSLRPWDGRTDQRAGSRFDSN